MIAKTAKLSDCRQKVGLIHQRDVSVPAVRPVRISGAVASVPVQGTELCKKPQQIAHFQQSSVLQMPSLQRSPGPQWQQLQQHPPPGSLPDWADSFKRQVRSLPQGKTALINLLHAVERLLQKADHCGHHSAVMKAYLRVGLIDLISEAWKQQLAQLQHQQHKVTPIKWQDEQLEAELALSGCRYMRFEAAHNLAKQLHVLLDDEGYSPSLELGALPAPHALGLGIPQLLQENLQLDLGSPVLRSQDPSTPSFSHASWDEYTAAAADKSMCGEWHFCYWAGDATWVPAPFGKFSTGELAAVLTPDVILSSLPNGIWGRALVTVAQEQGLPVDNILAVYQEQLGGVVGSSASVPDAVRALMDANMGLQGAGSNLRARMRGLSVAVASVRKSILGGPTPPASPHAQSN